MSVTKVTLLALAILVTCSICCTASVPTVISYQGKLTQPSGDPFPDGTYTITFSIYDVPNGGTAVWTEFNSTVQVKGGLFSVLLGSVTPIQPTVFSAPDRWFGIKVGTATEMVPRQKIASVAYAHMASTAQAVEVGAITPEMLAPGIATPPGAVQVYAGLTAPTGWLLCQGQAVSRTTYAALFAAIGTRYGAGDGSTTFNIPNLKGRVPVGGDSAEPEFNTIGETGGEKTHTLTVGEIPAHNHQEKVADRSGYTGTDGTAAGTGYTDDMHLSSYTANSTGGGGAHNNLQPYIAMHYIIKL